MHYVRKLGFEEAPDYDFLRELFSKVLKNIGEVEDGVFDWMLINGGKGLEAGAVRPRSRLTIISLLTFLRSFITAPRILRTASTAHGIETMHTADQNNRSMRNPPARLLCSLHLQLRSSKAEECLVPTILEGHHGSTLASNHSRRIAGVPASIGATGNVTARWRRHTRTHQRTTRTATAIRRMADRLPFSTTSRRTAARLPC